MGGNEFAIGIDHHILLFSYRCNTDTVMKRDCPFDIPIASVCPKSPLFSKSRAFWQLDFRHLGSGWHDFQL
ncbi:MAG: hypothetical protein RLZZ519_2426, partial [Bacteroidota bacterium]